MNAVAKESVLMPTCLAMEIRASGPNEHPLEVLECARAVAIRLHNTDASLTVYAGKQRVEVFALDLVTEDEISDIFDHAVDCEISDRAFVEVPVVQWAHCDPQVVRWVHLWNELRLSLLQRCAEATVARDGVGGLLYARRAFAADAKLRAAITRAMRGEVRGFCDHVLEHSGVNPAESTLCGDGPPGPDFWGTPTVGSE